MDKNLAGFRRIAPGIDHIHPMDPMLPQGCLAMHAPQFASYAFPTTFPVPVLGLADLAPAYAFEMHFLQHLQSGGRRGDRWVLKTPCHLMWLEALLKVVRDALFVRPTTVPASVSSLMSTIRSAVSDAIDPVAIGREQLDAWRWVTSTSTSPTCSRRPASAGRSARSHGRAVPPVRSATPCSAGESRATRCRTAPRQRHRQLRADRARGTSQQDPRSGQLHSPDASDTPPAAGSPSR